MSSNQAFTIRVEGQPARSAQSTEHSSSATDDEEEDSAGTGVNIHSPGGEIQEYSDQEESLVDDDSWTGLSKPVVPSESASRLSSAHEPRRPLNTRRRASKREEEQYEHHHPPPHRNTHLARARRQPYHSPPDSEVGYNEDLSLAEYGPGYMPPRSRPNSYYQPPPGGQGHHYGPGYGPQTSGGYGQYAPPPQGPHGQQLMRMPEGYSNTHYPYGQMQSPYYQPNQHPMQPPMPPQARGGFGAHDMAPHAPYMQHGMQPGMPPPGYFPNYPVNQLQQYMQNPQPVIQHFVPVQAPTPSPAPAPAAAPASTTPAPDSKASSGSAAPEPLNHPGYEELKKLLMEERATREEKERIAKAAEEARVKKAEEDKKKAEEILAAAKKAAEEAKSEAEKKAAEAAEEAAKKAAEEAGKIKSEAEEAMKKQAEEAATNAEKAKKEHEAALAAATANPPEKQKPIRFKDAVGRKFNFPFHLCQTWEGMEDLIKQAFLHVDVIGQHVADGHYDLIGPSNEIILPAVWETVIEPDWAITMHMWPLPEPEPDPKAEDNILAALDAAIAAEGKDKNDKRGKGKAKAKAKSAISSSHALPAGVEIVGGPQPPPPPAPPGSFAEGPTGGGKKKPKAAPGWSLFGRPPPKPKAKGPAPKK